MKYLLAIVLFCAASVALAQDRASGSVNPALERRVDVLGGELKCPVCQGSAIGESPSEFARSMMVELRKQVEAGKSDDEIKAYFVTRYGEDVLLKPRNLFVWVLPGVIVALGAVALVSYLRRASRASLPAAVSEAALERVRRDLAVEPEAEARP